MPDRPHAGTATARPAHARRCTRRASARAATRRRWTLVQGVLAPLQFLVFLVSLGLVLRFLATGEGYAAATVSIVRQDRSCSTRSWSPARSGRRTSSAATCSRRAFFWEDVVSMLVLALHTAYLVALSPAALAPRGQMLLALAAYATYVVNATQFLLKLRAARLEAAPLPGPPLRRHSEVRRVSEPRASAVLAHPLRPVLHGRPGAARARPARGVLRPDRHHLAAPQDPGRLLPRRRLAHLRAPDPVGRRRDDLRRAALRHRDHRRARPRRPRRRQRGTRPRRRRACSSAAPTSSCCSSSAPARPR